MTKKKIKGKKNNFRSILFFFLTVAIFLALYALGQRLIFPRAVLPPPVFSFLVEPEPLVRGKPFDLFINLETKGNNFRSFELEFSFDSERLELLNPGGIKNNLFALFDSALISSSLIMEKSEGKILLMGGRTNSSLEDGKILKITMKVKNGISIENPVNFRWESAEVAGLSPVFNDKTASLLRDTPASLFFALAEERSYRPGEILDLKISLNPGNAQVRGFQAVVNYNDQVFTFPNMRNLTDNIIVVDNSGFSPEHPPFLVDTQNKKIKMALIKGEQSVTGANNIHVLTIRFKVREDLSSSWTSAVFSFDTGSGATSISNLDYENVLGETSSYTVSLQGGSEVSITPTSVPTQTLTPIPTLTFTPTPTFTPIPTPTSTKTPTPTVVQSPTPTVTPPSGRENYLIPMGEKGALTIHISGEGKIPHVRFAVKFFGLEKFPEMKVRVKAIDMTAQLTPPPAPSAGDTCENGGYGEYLYKDVMLQADNSGVYRPKPETSFRYGNASYQITSDGWLPLLGVNPDHVFALAIKGPKHRNMILAKNLIFDKENPKPPSQDFNWAGEEKFYLEPGDLPDPNRGGKQDCVANMVDMSLIIARQRCTVEKSSECKDSQGNLLDPWLADVDENGIVNAGDISKVDHTLQTKPDDD